MNIPKAKTQLLRHPNSIGNLCFQIGFNIFQVTFEKVTKSGGVEEIS